MLWWTAWLHHGSCSTLVVSYVILNVILRSWVLWCNARTRISRAPVCMSFWLPCDRSWLLYTPIFEVRVLCFDWWFNLSCSVDSNAMLLTYVRIAKRYATCLVLADGLTVPYTRCNVGVFVYVLSSWQWCKWTATAVVMVCGQISQQISNRKVGKKR